MPACYDLSLIFSLILKVLSSEIKTHDMNFKWFCLIVVDYISFFHQILEKEISVFATINQQQIHHKLSQTGLHQFIWREGLLCKAKLILSTILSFHSTGQHHILVSSPISRTQWKLNFLLLLSTQVAQARNKSIGEHRYCYVTFKI